jgi:hypothetical protein
MDRLRNLQNLAGACALALLATSAVGCRNRDLRVPPLPRYSNESAVAPGPGAALQPADPYGGMNPYANSNLGYDPAAAPAGMSGPPPAAQPLPDPAAGGYEAPTAGYSTPGPVPAADPLPLPGDPGLGADPLGAGPAELPPPPEVPPILPDMQPLP